MHLRNNSLLIAAAFAMASCSPAPEPPIEQAGPVVPEIDLTITQESLVHGDLTPDRLYEIGLRHLTEGNFDKAVGHFDLAVKDLPKDAGLYAARGTAYSSMKKLTEALADFARAVELAPDNVGFLTNRALMYHSFERTKHALDDLARVIELDPSFVGAYFNRGVIHMNAADNEKALADFDMCVAIDPHIAAPYFNRAAAYEALGQLDEAKADYIRFTEISRNPENTKLVQEILDGWDLRLSTQEGDASAH